MELLKSNVSGYNNRYYYGYRRIFHTEARVKILRGFDPGILYIAIHGENFQSTCSFYRVDLNSEKKISLTHVRVNPTDRNNWSDMQVIPLDRGNYAILSARWVGEYYSQSRSYSMHFHSFWDLSSQKFTDFRFLKRDFLVNLIWIPNTTQVAIIRQNETDNETIEENENEKSKVEKKKKMENEEEEEEEEEEEKKEVDSKKGFGRYLCIVDYEKLQVLNSILIPGGPFPVRRDWNLVPMIFRNQYLFLLNGNDIHIYDTNNMYQLVRSFRFSSLLSPELGGFFVNISTFSRSQDTLGSLPFYFCGSNRNVFEFDPTKLETEKAMIKATEDHFFPASLSEYEIKNSFFIPERFLGFVLRCGEETEEMFLTVYDLFSKDYLRSFTQPLIPKNQIEGHSLHVQFVHNNVLKQDEEKCQEDLMIISLILGDGECLVFGYLTEEELMNYNDRMSFLFEIILSEEEESNEMGKGIQFLSYLLDVSIRSTNKFFEMVEKKELFIRMILGRRIWRYLDYSDFFNFFRFFDCCLDEEDENKKNQIERMKFVLCKEFFDFEVEKLRNRPQDFDQRIRRIEGGEEENNMKKKIISSEKEDEDLMELRNRFRSLLGVFKSCCSLYEIKKKEESNLLSFISKRNYYEPPFQGFLTLCCFNLLKEYQKFIPHVIRSILQEESDLWFALTEYRVSIRLEFHPTIRKEMKKKEETEMEGEHGEEEESKKRMYFSSFYELHKKRFQDLFESKENANMSLECYLKIVEPSGNSFNVVEDEKSEIKVIRCHKEILILKSNFFKAMLRFPGHESVEESKHGKLRIELLNFERTKLYLEFLYLGSIKKFSFADLMKLINHAEMFGEYLLAEYCAEKIRTMAKELNKIMADEKGESEGEEEDEFFEEDEIENTELVRQIRMTGSYLENEKIVWSVIVNCFWEFLSKEEIVKIINMSRREAGLEELDFSMFLMFPEVV